MERIIKFLPAWDKRNDPKGNFGINGVNLCMYLKGELGAVDFIVFTGWNLPEVEKELEDRHIPNYNQYKPLPADLGYHSPIPMEDGDTISCESCELLDGKSCYGDGSGLQADRIFDILVKQGSDGVWEELEKYYIGIFGELK